MLQWEDWQKWDRRPSAHFTVPAPFRPLTKTHALKDVHPLPTWLPLCWGPDEEWVRHMPAELSMPPTASANNEFLKGSTGEEGVRLSFFFSPQPKALLRDCFLEVHTPELSTAFVSLISALPQLLTQRAELLSQPQSGYCLPGSEAFHTHIRAEQLTHWQWPHRFWFFILPCEQVFFLRTVFRCISNSHCYLLFDKWEALCRLVLCFVMERTVLATMTQFLTLRAQHLPSIPG